MNNNLVKCIIYYKLNGLSMTIDRIYYYVRWENPIRLMMVKHFQRRRLLKDYSPNAKRLIIFLTSAKDTISGGILSINSIYNETCKLKNMHDAEVVMCTRPGRALLLKYTKFENHNYLFALSEVLSYFRFCQDILIHIPESYVEEFAKYCMAEHCLKKKIIKRFQSNIMLQNIDYEPSKESIEKLKLFGSVTITTAHEAYSTLETQERIGCPVHKLSTFVSPEQYHMRAYKEKENLMIVSPDDHEMKSTVLGIIAKAFPQLQLQVIENLSYDEFKTVISRAKWAITFGEGLDGYFIEPIFSGCVSFAVYNERFFTKDFNSFRTVYMDYPTLIENICEDMAALDNAYSYTQYNKEQYEICAKYYDYKVYLDNVSSFYFKYFLVKSPIRNLH